MSKKKPTSAKPNDAPAAGASKSPGFDVANFAAGVTHAPQEPPTTDTTAAPAVEDAQPSAETEQRVAPPAEGEPTDAAIDAAVEVIAEHSVVTIERGMQLVAEPDVLTTEVNLAPPDHAFYSPRQINVKLSNRQRMVFGMVWRTMMEEGATCEVYEGMPAELVGRYACRVFRCLLDAYASDYEAKTGVSILSVPTDDGKEESNNEESSAEEGGE